MPLIKTKTIKHGHIALWILFLIIILPGSYLLYSAWPSLLHISTGLQRNLNTELATLIGLATADPLRAGGLLVLFSFLYGLLHALGPGHGKVILSAYIATHPAKLRHSALLSFLASLLQGTVAVVLVSVVLFILQLSTRQLNHISQLTEKMSYAFIIVLGGFIIIRALRRLVITVPAKLYAIKKVTPLTLRSSAVLQPAQIHRSGQIPACGCGHQHVVADDALTGHWRTQAGMILAMGCRPCSGALLVLLFSAVIDVFHWGVIATFAMALGTGITLCAIALFVHSMRFLALRLTHTQGKGMNLRYGEYLRLIAGGIFIIAGILMYQTVSTPGAGFFTG